MNISRFISRSKGFGCGGRHRILLLEPGPGARAPRLLVARPRVVGRESRDAGAPACRATRHGTRSHALAVRLRPNRVVYRRPDGVLRADAVAFAALVPAGENDEVLHDTAACRLRVLEAADRLVADLSLPAPFPRVHAEVAGLSTPWHGHRRERRELGKIFPLRAGRRAPMPSAARSGYARATAGVGS